MTAPPSGYSLMMSLWPSWSGTPRTGVVSSRCSTIIWPGSRLITRTHERTRSSRSSSITNLKGGFSPNSISFLSQQSRSRVGLSSCHCRSQCEQVPLALYSLSMSGSPRDRYRAPTHRSQREESDGARMECVPLTVVLVNVTVPILYGLVLQYEPTPQPEPWSLPTALKRLQVLCSCSISLRRSRVASWSVRGGV